jgi:hypothetical protein
MRNHKFAVVEIEENDDLDPEVLLLHVNAKGGMEIGDTNLCERGTFNTIYSILPCKIQKAPYLLPIFPLLS